MVIAVLTKLGSTLVCLDCLPLWAGVGDAVWFVMPAATQTLVFRKSARTTKNTLFGCLDKPQKTQKKQSEKTMEQTVDSANDEHTQAQPENSTNDQRRNRFQKAKR